jgi:hypothetical protein
MNIQQLTKLIKILKDKGLASYVTCGNMYFRSDGVFDSIEGGIKMIPNQDHIDSTYQYIFEEIIKKHVLNKMTVDLIEKWMDEYDENIQ